MEERVTRLEEQQQDVELTINAVKIDMREFRKELDGVVLNIKDVEKNIAIIMNDSAYTREGISGIKSDVTELRRELKEEVTKLRDVRNEDHFIKPLARQDIRNEKIWWAIVGGILAALVTAILTSVLAVM